MHHYGVFASRWPQNSQTVWTVVNRNEYAINGPQMSVTAPAGTRFFDLYHGSELTPERQGDTAVLSFALEPHGFGAVLATDSEPNPAFKTLMAHMRSVTAVPLSKLADTWTPLPQHLVDIPPTKRATQTPPGMIRIEGGPYSFRVEGTEIEGSDDIGVDVQYPWEDSPRRFHEHHLDLKPYFIDRFPVTNQDFKKFLDATHYQPADNQNFLHDWKAGSYPDGWANKPVTWVSLEDARAYATWAGKRLPHEWEWQFAAQGSDQRTYPWGNEWNPSAVPVPEKGRAVRPPDAVDAHPTGASPYGVQDLVGNIWQWTDEYEDEHTRAAILRGGNAYQPQGSIWYFPEAYRNGQHSKLLLMAPSYDRSATVGFRCAMDAK